MRLYGVEIEDQQQRKMFQMKELGVDLRLLPLLHHEVSISQAKIKGLEARLFKPASDSDSVANYQFVIEAFKSKKQPQADSVAVDTMQAKKAPMIIDVKKIALEDIKVSYNDSLQAQLGKLHYKKNRKGQQFVEVRELSTSFVKQTKKGPVDSRLFIGMLDATGIGTQYKLTIENLSYQTDNHQPRKNVGKPHRGAFDVGHFDVLAKFDIQIDSLGKDTLVAQITNGMAEDRGSGLLIKELLLKVNANKRTAHLSDVSIKLPHTSLAIANADFQLPKTAYNYTGNPVMPVVNATYNGNQLVQDKDYTLTYENNINIGTATVNVNGIGDYSGTAKLQYRIRLGNPPKVTCTNVASGMKVSWEKVSGATRYKVYRDGKLIFTTSALVVTDKEVKYKGGTKFVYKVVATEKNTGDSDLFKTATYYRLMPVGIKSLSNPSAGKMTVTYDKSAGCYGYVVRYGLNSDMSDAKVITVSGANTTSRTFGGMKKGKTYYVQVRTYMLDNGVRYYSGYCTTKTITIKK